MLLKAKTVTICAAGAAIALSAAALTVAPADTARASSTCWNANLTRTDPYGSTYHVYYCYNVAPTALFYTPTRQDPQVGTLASDPSWFACKIDDGERNRENNGPHPYRWLWTKADTPAGQWGWVPDDQIYSETNPVPNC